MTEFSRSARVSGLEARRSCQQNSCYRLHSHDALSIGLIDEGTSVFSGPLGGTIRLAPGDVTVIASGQVHACNPEKGRWVYQMIHADQDWCESLTPSGASSPMFTGVRVLRQPKLRALVEAFSNAVVADESVEGIETAGAALFEALESVSPTHVVTSAADPELIERLTPVMERLSSALGIAGPKKAINSLTGDTPLYPPRKK